MTDLDPSTAETPRPAGAIDARGPRVSAGITALLLLAGIALALVGNSTGGSLASLSPGERAADPGFLALSLVALLFAWSLVSARTQPLSALFRAVIQPRLSPPTEWEDPRPPRFAQGVGLVVVGAGLLLHLLGVPWALAIAGAAAFVAAALNASIGFCLGCEIYLLLARAGITGRGGLMPSHRN
ncbi:DUF4395 family protein [Leucobacter sp.]